MRKKMTTIRRCPVCRSAVNSSDSTHCPECGAVLDREFSDAESIRVDNIIKKVKQQIVSPDDRADVQTSGTGGAGGGRDIAEILSEAAFQSILNENCSRDEDSAVEDSRSDPEMSAGQGGVSDGPHPYQSDSGFEDAGKKRAAPFGTVLESFKQVHSSSGLDDARDDVTKSSPDTSQEFDSLMVEEDPPVAEQPYSGKRPEQHKPAASKSRTWWGGTRQTLWLLCVLLLCIVFFRIFGPERKEPTLEDFFRPGNPDIEFLDAIEFLEKHYEKQRKQNAGIEGISANETFADSLQSSQPVGAKAEESFGQASDNATIRGLSSPAFKGPTP